MTIAAVVAHDPNLLIGGKDGLPWHYPKDLKFFKETTMGHSIIMGRKVFEEIDEKPLPGRENIVLSRSRNYDHVPTFSSIEDAIDYVKDEDLVYLIGGGEIYRQFMPRIDRLIVTEIPDIYEGDTYFPEYRDKIGTVWEEVNREEKGELSFVVYKRIK